MSERIYALLLRLYPARFRNEYGDAALQLFRDRSNHERGLLLELRLWIDVLADLVVSLPSAYRHDRAAVISAKWPQRLGGAPVFCFLEGKALRAGGLLYGGMLSVGVFALIASSIAHGASRRPASSWMAEPQRSGSARFSAESQAPQASAQTTGGAAVADNKLDAAERQRVIDAVIANLKGHYIYPDVAQKVADALLSHEKAGEYDAITDGATFADLLTKQLRDMSHDMHFEVVYSHNPLPDRPAGPSPEVIAQYRAALEQQNCTFQKVEILPHNIRDLKLNSFPDPSICESTAKAAMASLNGASAIIFDLRDNRGGDPNMVMLMAAYLFDHPEYMYNPREDTTEQSWTRSPVLGSSLSDKPVYVLTSARTFSGAEHFSYDLKMLKRATLVGETTGGATDVGNFHRIDDHFGIGIREARAINPYSELDWAVTGVEPDVKVTAADALKTAEKLAESEVQKK
jgi:hypothetical protein